MSKLSRAHLPFISVRIDDLIREIEDRRDVNDHGIPQPHDEIVKRAGERLLTALISREVNEINDGAGGTDSPLDADTREALLDLQKQILQPQWHCDAANERATCVDRLRQIDQLLRGQLIQGIEVGPSLAEKCASVPWLPAGLSVGDQSRLDKLWLAIHRRVPELRERVASHSQTLESLRSSEPADVQSASRIRSDLQNHVREANEIRGGFDSPVNWEDGCQSRAVIHLIPGICAAKNLLSCAEKAVEKCNIFLTAGARKCGIIASGAPLTDQAIAELAVWVRSRNPPPRADVPALSPATSTDLLSIDPAPSAGTDKGEEDTPPAYAELRRFARAELKGQERAVVEALCDAGGELSLADVKTLCGWQDPIDDSWNSLRKRLNKKLDPHGWKVKTQDRAARLTPSAE